MEIRHILISRTDSIGDVILTLPVAGFLKLHLPGVRVSFLGMPYTKDVIEACSHIDQFIDWKYLSGLPEEESVKQLQTLNADVIIHVFPRNEIARLAKKAGIKQRIGATGRIYHWWTCNKLVPLSRKNSELHESLLNLKLAEAISGAEPVKKLVSEETSRKSGLRESEDGNVQTGTSRDIRGIPSLYGLSLTLPTDNTFEGILDPAYINVILHPRSKGSAREWGIGNFGYLARELAGKSFQTGVGSMACKVFISGTKEEGKMLYEEGFFELAGPDVIDMTGRFNLKEFMNFINAADVMVAGSTGPLHIASALGKIALGLYPPIRPMHPGRWAPLGVKADYLVADKECSMCRNQSQCECMKLITPVEVLQKIEGMVLKYYSQTMLA